MSHEDLLDLVAVYALGSLGPEEARIVSAHLATCTECRAEYAALRPAANAIGFATNDVAIDALRSERMKRRVLAAIAPGVASPSATKVQFRSMLVTTVAAVAAGLVLGFFTVTMAHRLAETRAELARSQQTLAELGAAGAQRYDVPHGVVLKTPERVYLVMQTMPQAPRGRVYQAWTLAPGAKTVAPSTTFVPDRDGFVVVSLPEPAAKISAVAVSVEPPGGSRAPTTKPAFIRPLT